MSKLIEIKDSDIEAFNWLLLNGIETTISARKLEFFKYLYNKLNQTK